MEFKKYLEKIKKYWLKILIVIAVVGGGIYYFFLKPEEATVTTLPKVVAVEKGDLRVTVTGTGQVEALSQVDLKSVVAGDAADVTSVMVKEDQEVKKGQIIATVDSTDASREVQAAALDLQSAQIKMKQTEKLYPAETKTDKYERQTQELAVKQSELSLAQAREKLSDYTIRAPFDGIVTGLSVEAGDALANDTILASVITKEMKVAITLNEVDAAKVTKGNTVNLALDALPEVPLTGVIEKIDTIGTTDSGVVSYGAEITLDEQQATLRPGMSVSAEILVSEKQGVLLVPNEAISSEDGKSFVRVVSGCSTQSDKENTQGTETTRGQRKEIRIGATNDIQTEVLSGLTEGEKVIAGTQPTGTASNATTQSGDFSLFGSQRPRTGNFQSR